MNASEIRSKVDEILGANEITYSVRLVGETTRDDNWKCDAWRVTFKPTNGKPYESDYFTGIGHRKPIKGAPSDKGNPRTLYRENWEKRYLIPVAPSAADVLHSLVLDASANDMSFSDWCGDYGYSDDSLKALDAYRACCDAAIKLRSVFSHEALAAIRDAVRDL